MEDIFDCNSKFPTDVLENIFSRIPLQELLTSHCLVCKDWSEVILNPCFMPWKKLYFNYKLQSRTPMSAVLLSEDIKEERHPHESILYQLAEEFGLCDWKSFITNSIRMMGTVFKSPEDYGGVCRRLQNHTLYDMANNYLKSNPEPFTPEHRNAWHLVAAMVLFANSVWEIDSLLQLLLRRRPLFSTAHVIDAFYCLAVFLIYAHRKYHMPTRYHFMLYYVLFLFENSPPTRTVSADQQPPAAPSVEPPPAVSTGWKFSPQKKGQLLMDNFVLRNNRSPSLEGHCSQTVDREAMGTQGSQTLDKEDMDTNEKLTYEQLRIINYNIKHGDVVKIIAFAGTGKTTTLLEFCKAKCDLNFLLVVYNKSVQTYWEEKFPKNTVVRTAHSLAYSRCGKKFREIGKLQNNLQLWSLSSLLRPTVGAGIRYRRAKLVILTLEKFMNSADESLNISHVPTKDSKGENISHDQRNRIFLEDAKEIWQQMTECKGTQKISITHDGYLKLWQLRKPVLPQYDVILIDEAQDMNPAIFDIFMRQDAAKIVVGDPFQQIYRFRGVINALEGLDSTVTFYLTQSFRFGPEIAYTAQCILEGLLEVSKHTLVGASKKDSANSDPRVDKVGIQRAYLARTNCSLYKLALEMCCSEAFRFKSFTFAGGISGYRFDDIVDIFKLSQIERGVGTRESLEIKNKFIARFSKVSALQNYAKETEDTEMLTTLSMYKYSGNKTEQHVDLLKEKCCSDPTSADIVFSTIHKSKGLEWEWVILVDDIMSGGITSRLCNNDDDDEHDEFNLLYVSVTRAKKYLTINPSVLEAYSLCMEKMESLYPICKMPPGTRCCQCGRTIDLSLYNTLITKVSQLHLFSAVFSEGFICNVCAMQREFRFPTLPDGPDSPKTHLDYCRMFRRACLVGRKGIAVTPAIVGWEQYASKPLSFHKNQLCLQ